MRIHADTLGELWEQTYQKVNPDDVFVQIEGRNYTYRRLNAYAHCLAAFLVLKGFQKGDKVVLIGDNEPLYFSFELAVQFLGGVNISLANDSPHLEKILNEIQAPFLFLASYSFYNGGRSWLDVLARRCVIVCHALPNEPREKDQISTLESAIYLGKNYWRENFVRLRDFKKRVSTSDEAAYFIETQNDTPVGFRSFKHRQIIEVIEYQLNLLNGLKPPPATFSAVISQADLVGRTAGFYTPLALGARLIFAENYNLYLTFLLHYQPEVVVLDPPTLDKLLKNAFLDFQHRKSIRARYYDSSLAVSGKVLESKSAPSLLLRLRYYLARKFTLAPFKRAYFSSIRIVLLSQTAEQPETTLKRLRLMFNNTPLPSITAPLLSFSAMKRSGGAKNYA